MRRAWLAHHDPAVAAAERRAAALGPGVHATLLAAGDRLAEVSALVALRMYAHAAAAWTRFGPEGFRRWIAHGTELAAGSPACREGALGYFAVPPDAFGPGGLETAAAWCALGADVARTSRRLASAFFAQTPAVLARPDGIERLRAWADAGLRLYQTRGWRGAFLAQSFFDATGAALGALGPAQYGLWAELGATFAGEVEERDFFASLPAGLAGWSDDDRTGFLTATLAFARGGVRHARVVYRELPRALGGVTAAERTAIIDILSRCSGDVASAVAGFVPVAGAILRAVPRGVRLEALARVHELAGHDPAAAVAALGVLPRLYEEAAPEQVQAWFTAGIAVAADNPAAGRAYFALESRTSLKVLHAVSTAASLEETEGVWRKLIQMLGGEGVTVRGVEGLTLRAPLEDVPAEREVALPAKVDVLPTHEENCRVYRFLAAQLAGRREFGTYETEGLRTRLASDDGLLEDLFLVLEGVRVQHRIAAAYPGLAGEGAWIGSRLLARWAEEERPLRSMALDAMLALVLGAEPRPRWLPAGSVAVVTDAARPLGSPTATVEDSMRIARELATAFAVSALRLPAAELTGELMLDDLTGGDPLDVFGTAGSEVPGAEAPPLDDPHARIDLAPETGERTFGGRPLGAEELRRLVEAGARIGQGRGETGSGGIPITDLMGKLPRAELDALRRLLDEPGATERPTDRPTREERAFYYDEWDHAIGDYRTRWCRLEERLLAGDSGEFFTRALDEYAALLPEVRRQFQRIRPEMYRPVRGLEDGEDFDLNAVTDARIEVRARRAPSTRLYRSRVREARDVATLFLLDMSASTDEPLPPNGRAGRRVIDALKEALVVMTQALDELGDAYAIYGFSGQGRANVEFYLVKGFAEPLGPVVKGRIGGIVPKRSTRMGTALRHAAHKMAAVAARAKHLMLLSDGFPQDDDYGEDRRSHVYGIRDTAVALREADSAGITPFCITVDRAGHDYLRQMCDASRYLVIDDIAALPRELPKVYRRVVRA